MHFPDSVLERAGAVSLAIFDVDGVLTDGRITYNTAGDETKSFHVHDGSAIRLLQQHGIPVALISGRNSPAVTRRAGELGILHVYQGIANKAEALDALIEATGIAATAMCHVGDDLPDLVLYARVALGIGVPDGHPVVVERADYVTSAAGGTGVAREVCELLLRAHGAWPYS